MSPIGIPTTKQATIFKDEQAGEDAAERQRQHDLKIELLIGRKNHQRLRVCGYEVSMKDPAGLPLTTTDQRSL